MIRFTFLVLATLMLTASAASISVPVELRGSPASMERQNAVALEAGLTFARTFDDIERMLETGELVRLLGNEHYDLREGLNSDAARPEVRLFVERLAADYFEATGEKLVVTSLTRPSSSQPANAHALSVHPTGKALDLRISQQAASRQWIEQRLLEMEAQGLLDVTRERTPPHYHVALFSEAYLAHVEELIGADALLAALTGEEILEEAELIEEEAEVEETVRRRSPWSFIASMFGRGR